MYPIASKIKHGLQEKISKEFKLTCISEHEEYAKGQHKILFDNYFIHNNTTYIIELEIYRTDPITNVIKTLLWLNYLRGKKREITLIQIFNSKSYENRNIDYCRFLGKRAHLLGKKFSTFNYYPEIVSIDEKLIKRDNAALSDTIDLFFSCISKRVK